VIMSSVQLGFFIQLTVSRFFFGLVVVPIDATSTSEESGAWTAARLLRGFGGAVVSLALGGMAHTLSRRSAEKFFRLHNTITFGTVGPKLSEVGRRSWSIKLGSKLDVSSWGYARFDIQLGPQLGFCPNLISELDLELGLELSPKLGCMKHPI